MALSGIVVRLGGPRKEVRNGVLLQTRTYQQLT